MPPTKAAKKAAKHAAKHPAKKAAKHHAKKAAGRHSHSDLRRAYEHLGRIEILDRLLGDSSPAALTTVVELARQQLTGGLDLAAADLLRGAEHLSFAALEATDPPAEISPALEIAITAEFDHLLARAADLTSTRPGSRPPASRSPRKSGSVPVPVNPLAVLIPALIQEARTAHQVRDFRVALELARAAEALAHVELTGTSRLKPPASRRHLA